MKLNKGIVALAVVAAAACLYFAYMAWAFPAVRCEAARHLKASEDMQGECYACHVKATPRLAQEWYESKHGIMMVRCQTCHGMPDNTGSVPFAAKPGKDICLRCHSLAIERMEAKFGRRDDCATCHLQHQSPMHGDAYQYRQPSNVTTLDR